MHVLTGLETWFTLPTNAAAMIPPPRYKMAIVSWLAIYPLVILILEVLHPILDHVSIPIRAAMISIIAIFTMTYALMPCMTRLFEKWLYPPAPETIAITDEHHT